MMIRVFGPSSDYEGINVIQFISVHSIFRIVPQFSVDGYRCTPDFKDAKLHNLEIHTHSGVFHCVSRDDFEKLLGKDQLKDLGENVGNRQIGFVPLKVKD